MSDFPVKITEAALKQFQLAAIGEEQCPDAVRLGVKGGGCSGFLYNLAFIDNTDIDPEEDIVAEIGGLKFVTDIYSAEYLKNTTVDFVKTLKESGFKFVNPDVKRTCGCGQSFSA